jgi:hypothetical protein
MSLDRSSLGRCSMQVTPDPGSGVPIALSALRPRLAVVRRLQGPRMPSSLPQARSGADLVRLVAPPGDSATHDQA